MRILFICVENTCRSQMAEGWAANMGYQAQSAGLKAGEGVNQMAVKVMEEMGVDISNQYSKSLQMIEENGSLTDFDFIISLCSADAQAICPAPLLEGGRALNWQMDDPKNGDGSIESYRVARDLIRDKLLEFKSVLPV